MNDAARVGAPRCLLFDLGGVVVHFDGLARLGALLRRGSEPELPLEEVKTRWIRCEAVRQLERGRLPFDAFAERTVAELGLSCTPAELVADFDAWISPRPEALALLDELRAAGHRLACLSNTNVRHWQLMESWGVAERFEQRFLSHLSGRVKPDREAFVEVIETTRLAPAEILFLDDSRINVEAAREAGLRAEQVLGPEDCRRVLAAELP